jgi:hypothetical protein
VSDPNEITQLLYSRADRSKASITAYELREVFKANKMPKNVSNSQWKKICDEIKELEKANKFIDY